MDLNLNIDGYDPDENFLSPLSDVANQVLDWPNSFLNTPSPSSMDPSNHSSLDSSPRLPTLLDPLPFSDVEYNSDSDGYSMGSLFDNLGTTLPLNDHLEIICVNNQPAHPSSNFIDLEMENDKLVMIAEPKAMFRARYESEVNPTKNRAQRYIRTEDGTPKYDHPTIKIPSKWLDPTRSFYIRVTSVTIKTNHTPYHCIHPYKIDTLAHHVLKDRKNNSLYFPINSTEMNTGDKSFFISLTKMIQSELKTYGPLRLFDANENDNRRTPNIRDAKQMISHYQLWKCQLIFTVAELTNVNSFPIPYCYTSIQSRIMTDECGPSPNSSNQNNEVSSNQMKCIPQQGKWEGNEEIVIIMPNAIKKKEYAIWFDFGDYGTRPANEIRSIDTKTIVFRTPPCPFPSGNDDIIATIIIQENRMELAPLDFHYLTPIKIIINRCPHCHEYDMNNPSHNKRRWEYDNIDNLISQTNKMSLSQTSESSSLSTTTINPSSKFDDYLNRLKDALQLFVRKNDPSRLFRRTRILLSQYDEDTSPLHDAIENGHNQLALSLVEQILNMPSPNRLLENGNENGETPLLLAAKFNQWKLIEIILTHRSDLIKQKDNDGNNLLHLLANSNEDQASEIIGNILQTFSTHIAPLLKEENQSNQTPMNIAQSIGNSRSFDLFTIIS